MQWPSEEFFIFIFFNSFWVIRRYNAVSHQMQPVDREKPTWTTGILPVVNCVFLRYNAVSHQMQPVDSEKPTWTTGILPVVNCVCVHACVCARACVCVRVEKNLKIENF